MQVDWFTIIAQALNFLVLVWVMKRFLYKPILGVIDEREKRISDQVAAADMMKVEAKKERDEYEEKNGKLIHESAALMDSAKAEAHAERQKLLEEARETAEAYSAKHKEALKNEELALRLEIEKRIRKEVLALVRDALSALAGIGLEERIVELFNDRIQTMEDEEKQTLRTALKGSDNSVTVRSGLDLNDKQKATTEEIIKTLLGADTRIIFETEPDLISGIELNANGHKAAWSIDEYLSSINRSGVHSHER